MSTIQQNILDTFYEKLATCEGFNQELIMQVRELFEANKKLNAADLVKVLSGESRKELP